MNFKDLLNNNATEVKCRIIDKAFDGVSGESDMEAINKMALKPIKAEEVFIFDLELSNSNVDAYYTRMTVESLQNYADRINQYGVPLMAHHIDEAFPVGRMFRGEVIKTEDGVNRLMVRSYIVRDDEGDGISAKDIIRKIETGVQKDVSIGFLSRGYTCSICGGQMIPGWSNRAEGVGNCDHVVGGIYDGQTCYAWVEDGIIIEGSLVYTGATPEAMIKKAVNQIKSGKLDAKMINSINQALNTNININNEKGDQTMKGKELLEKVANSIQSEALKNKLMTRSVEMNEDATEEDATKIVSEEVEAVAKENDELRSENEELKAQADEGKEYREGLVEEAVTNGIKALGKDFNEEQMRAFFKSSNTVTIKAINSQYSLIINKLLGDSNNSIETKTDLEENRGDEKIHAEIYK